MRLEDRAADDDARRVRSAADRRDHQDALVLAAREQASSVDVWNVRAHEPRELPHARFGRARDERRRAHGGGEVLERDVVEVERFDVRRRVRLVVELFLAAAALLRHLLRRVALGRGWRVRARRGPRQTLLSVHQCSFGGRGSLSATPGSVWATRKAAAALPRVLAGLFASFAPAQAETIVAFQAVGSSSLDITQPAERWFLQSCALRARLEVG
mmetsp:Transcript_24589/g.75829  ORF Transcript_24589/g.75829 Transcript_24589/m.75829 type:complete len:214 (+) Transcript_24589:1052-1693(+)